MCWLLCCVLQRVCVEMSVKRSFLSSERLNTSGSRGNRTSDLQPSPTEFTSWRTGRKALPADKQWSHDPENKQLTRTRRQHNNILDFHRKRYFPGARCIKPVCTQDVNIYLYLSDVWSFIFYESLWIHSFIKSILGPKIFNMWKYIWCLCLTCYWMKKKTADYKPFMVISCCKCSYYKLNIYLLKILMKAQISMED